MTSPHASRLSVSLPQQQPWDQSHGKRLRAVLCTHENGRITLSHKFRSWVTLTTSSISSSYTVEVKDGWMSRRSVVTCRRRTAREGGSGVSGD